MYNEGRFICDYCHVEIKADEFALIDSVDKNCCSTGEIELHLHLHIDKSSLYGESRGGKGCYRSWLESEDGFTPCGVRKISKKDYLESKRV